MSTRAYGILASAAALLALAWSQPAYALTMQECGAKYEAAKAAGTLDGMTWNEFRKAECSADAAAAPSTPRVAPRAAAPAASGLTMQECGAKYEAAKAAGALGGMTWNEFRKAECSADAAAAPSAPRTAARSAATTSAGVGNAVFPRAVSPRYSGESAGMARMYTCLEQYDANKASNQNGGLKWTEKGGGYYSECDKILKSASSN